MRTEPYRWRLSPGFAAHLWKAATQQHHREMLPLLARLVPRDASVFDVGAHAGQFTKLFARLARDGRVYAIEPATYARTILRSVIWLRRLDNVTIVPLALAAEPGLAWLHTPLKQSGAFGFGLAHLGPPEARWSCVAAELVGRTTIDDLAAALALGRLDLIKADIEGAEMRMLAGAERTIERLRPRVMIELDDRRLAHLGDAVGDTLAYFGDRNYRTFSWPGGDRLLPAAAPTGGDLWFLPAEDPLIAAITETAAAAPAAC